MGKYGGKTEDGSSDTATGQIEEVGVGSGPVLETLKGRAKQHVVRNGSMGGSVESKMLKIVPRGRSDPSVLRFGGLGADEASRISDSESSDSANVSKDGVVDLGRNQPVPGVLIQRVGFREKNGRRNFEVYSILGGVERKLRFGDEHGMNWSDGVKAGYRKGEFRRDDF